MQKLTILTLVVTALWLAVFGMPEHVAIAWQAAETAPDDDQPQPPSESADAPDSPTGEIPLDPEVVAEAEALLQQARDRLYAYQSVEAQLVERASFGNRRFSSEGRYLAGPFPQLRLEYRIRVGESEGVILEVCDGQVLRTSKHIQPVGSQPSDVDASQYQVSRKNVRRILQASDVEGTPPQAVLQAELGIGGLPALLASIERAMEFEAVQEQTYQGQSFHVLQGRWRQEFLEGLDDDSQMAAAAQQVVPFMPHRVRVYLHQETLFPMRILYLRTATAEPVTYRAIMSIEFSDVKLNEGVDPDEFRFIPPEGVREVDETNLYIQMIEAYRASQDRAAESEGAEAAGTTDDGSALPEATGNN